MVLDGSSDCDYLQLPERLYKSLDFMTKKLRFTMPFPLLAFPLYLVRLRASLLYDT
jgi:omega-3 fatty acid desaturase (delta-15 desaturase)